MPDKIKQPKNVNICDGNFKATLAWHSGFADGRNADFSTAQKFIDSECIRLMSRYTPMRTGLLAKSPILGTKIGSGHIVYASPYARYQYYGVLMVSSVNGSAWARSGESKVLTNKPLQYDKTKHPQAQRLWFETMKTNHGKAILRGAAAVAGGKVK